MITNHTTRSGQNDQIGGVTGSWRPMAVGVGLAVVGALLIVAVLLSSYAGALPFRFSLSDGTGIQPAGHSPNIPISSAGSAYDGSAYVQYLLAGPSAEPAAPVATNPNVPISNAGSAYDGSAYVQYLLAGPFTQTPNVPVLEAGSAYDSSAYVQYLLASPFAQTPISRTGSAYDGSAYVQYLLAGPSAEPAEHVATNPNVPIRGTGSAYNGGN